MTMPTRPADYDLALRALRQQGVSTEDSRKLFQLDPAAVTRLAAVGLEQWADEETAKAQTAFNESEAGKRAAAQKQIAEEQEAAARREEAKALIRAAGGPDTDFTDADLTSITGLEISKPAPVEQYGSILRNQPPSDAEMAENLAAIERISKGGEAA